jgi:hypothetical protein
VTLAITLAKVIAFLAVKGEPAQLDVGDDAVALAVEHGPQFELLEVSEAALDVGQGLVAPRDVLRVEVRSEVRSRVLPSSLAWAAILGLAWR